MPDTIIETDSREAWKSYPVRIMGPDDCQCGKPMYLVEDKGRNGVTQNWIKQKCVECKRIKNFDRDMIDLFLACPKCGHKMEKKSIPDQYDYGKHGYQCPNCGEIIFLAEIVPSHYPGRT